MVQSSDTLWNASEQAVIWSAPYPRSLAMTENIRRIYSQNVYSEYYFTTNLAAKNIKLTVLAAKNINFISS